LRIIFHQCQQPPQRPIELVIGLDFRSRAGRSKKGCASVGDVREDGLLLRSVTLHCFNQIRDQVDAACQIDIHL